MRNIIVIFLFLKVSICFSQFNDIEEKQYNYTLKLIKLIEEENLKELNRLLTDIENYNNIKKIIDEVKKLNHSNLSINVVLSYEEKDTNVFKCGYFNKFTLDLIYQINFYYVKNSLIKVNKKDKNLLDKELNKRLKATSIPPSPQKGNKSG